jgi:hypothetical protein
MCDCYEEKCAKRECDAYLPVHLADFETGRDEIQVFCARHIPARNVRIFKIRDKIYGRIKMGIRYLTANAKKHADGNHPNAAYFQIVEPQNDKKKVNGTSNTSSRGGRG